MKDLFWFSFILIVYTYIGYPMIVYIISLFYREHKPDAYIYPDVSIIISAYNEEKHIEAKLSSIFELDYPKEKIEVLIGSDGSTDRTNEMIAKHEIASAPAAPRNDKIKIPRNDSVPLKLYKQSQRQGKPSILNKLVKESKAEILVFTDARQVLDRDSVKELVKNFSDNRVGSVSAELFFRKEDSQVGSGVGLYWEYEKFIRKAESRIGSMLGATGALYAVRRELFCEAPEDLILDDMYIPMRVVEKGYRAIFDRDAKVYDTYSSGAREEFGRKTRTLAGNFQFFMKVRWPWRIGWQIISHKYLRLIMPYLLAALLISNFFIMYDNAFYSVFILMQVLFYIFASAGIWLKRKNRICDVSYMFCVMNAAAVEGLVKFIMGKQEVAWKK
jgi:cellulose synthase/poly-beta-1,6-N-acetylglucosamine synthase-like glycosyltransferase